MKMFRSRSGRCWTVLIERIVPEECVCVCVCVFSVLVLVGFFLYICIFASRPPPERVEAPRVVWSSPVIRALSDAATIQSCRSFLFSPSSCQQQQPSSPLLPDHRPSKRPTVRVRHQLTPHLPTRDAQRGPRPHG